MRTVHDILEAFAFINLSGTLIHDRIEKIWSEGEDITHRYYSITVLEDDHIFSDILHMTSASRNYDELLTLKYVHTCYGNEGYQNRGVTVITDPDEFLKLAREWPPGDTDCSWIHDLANK